MQHIYQNVPGWFTFEEFYAFIIKKLPVGAKVAEVGAYQGQSASYLIVESINQEKKFDITIIDCWPGDLFQIFLKHLKPLEGLYKTIHAGSQDAVKKFEDNSLDFVYIDAEHSYKAVKEDIKEWMPKVKSGGIIAGHDYDKQEHPGVCQAVEESLPSFSLIKESWYYEKP